MFIANLMVSVLALAMVGASNASVSKSENNAVRSAENTSFVASQKKAYYDQTETYGTTQNTAYNYSSYEVRLAVQTSSTPPAPTQPGQSYTPYTSTYQIPSGVYEGMYSYPCSPLVPQEDYEAQRGISVDVYLNGNFYITLEQPYYGGGIQIYLQTGSGNYIWIFDHGTAPEPYTPVDILGDIAEGLTGGIVPVAEGVGNGLQSLVQDIFLNADNDGLSVFGIVVICFAGLALALGLSRWVLNFVDTLGARAR